MMIIGALIALSSLWLMRTDGYWLGLLGMFGFIVGLYVIKKGRDKMARSDNC